MFYFFILLILKSQFKILYQLNEQFKQWMLFSNRCYIALYRTLCMNYSRASAKPAGIGDTDLEKTSLVRFYRCSIILFLILNIILFQLGPFIKKKLEGIRWLGVKMKWNLKCSLLKDLQLLNNIYNFNKIIYLFFITYKCYWFSDIFLYKNKNK